MTKAKEKIVNTPLEYGITTVEDFLNLKARDYQDTSFISNQVIKYDKGLKIAGNLNRLMQVKDYIARVEINIPKEDDITPEKSRFITVKPKLAATVKNPYLILDCSNNRTEDKNFEPVYEVELKEAISGREFKVKIDFDNIANDRLFKSGVKTLSALAYNEISEFIANFITKNNPKQVTQYSNSGRINIFGNMDWIWSNSAYIDGKMYSADKNGNISIGNDKYIRVIKNSRRLLPTFVPNSKPIEQVVTYLFNNIFESWNGAIEPFLALSFMAMSPYCPEFWKKEGFGSIAFVGDTEAGKTEITGLGLALFGYDKSFMGTTRNTLVGVEQKMNTVNCIPVIIDDISKFKLGGDSFIDELKRLMTGAIRDKGKNGQESGALPPCCPFGFSSNYLPTEKPEIMNRILYLDTENVNFNPEKFNYFEGKGVNELSCILPYILDVGFDTINNIHTEIKQMLIKKYVGISDRMVSQIAIALTGIEVFRKISNGNINVPMDKINEYILTCMKRFKQTQSPIDKILDAMPILIWERRIQEGLQYKLNPDNLTMLTLHKTAMCHAYNRYFESDISKQINSRQIKNIDGETYKILKFNKPQDIRGKKRHSIIIDISNHPSRDDILANHQKIIQSNENNTW